MAEIGLKVNGKTQTVGADPETSLLYVLRNQLELNGPKFGCGLMQRGACTVLVDGPATRSCPTPVTVGGDKEVITLEGLGTEAAPFIDERAAQCAPSSPDMILAGAPVQ